MSSPRASVRVGLLAVLIVTLLAVSPARPEPTVAGGAVAGRVWWPDKPRQLAARLSLEVARLVAHSDGGFLLAWSSFDDLVVAEHGEDGSREALRRLGSLGYGGNSNLRSVQPLGDDGFVASWDTDHHYAGFQGSHVAFFGPDGRREVTSRTRRAPALVDDGGGGAIGLFTDGQRTFFGTWHRSGRLLRQRPMHDMRWPWQAWPYRGGMLIRSFRTTFPDSLTEWVDATGKRIESAPGEGVLATNGEDVIAELAVSDERLLVRAAESPKGLGKFRFLEAVPRGRYVSSIFLAASPHLGADRRGPLVAVR